jgi:mono/diheme cytochrome c family protein
MSTWTKMLALAVAVVLVCAGMSLGQQPAADKSDKVIKHVAVRPVTPASGEDMYNAYCAVCHGKDLKGGGPAASALKNAPTDLTQLSARNKGEFPFARVGSAIRGDVDLPAHGSKDMPVWGPLFWHMSEGHQSEVHQRVTNLSKYVESKQVK